MGTNRRTKIRFPVFSDFTITVILSQDAASTSRHLRMRRKPGEDITENESAAFLADDDNPCRCWLVFSADDINEGIIAHEAGHAIWHMLKTVGVGLDEETFMYHLGHLVSRLHKFLK